jgi:hypothetical protein
MGLTEQPRADRPVSDFDPNNPKDDARDVAAREPETATAGPHPGGDRLPPRPGDARDHSGAGPGLTNTGGVSGGATDGMPGTDGGSPNG